MKTRQVMNSGTVREFDLVGNALEYRENGTVVGVDTLTDDQVADFKRDMYEMADMENLEIVSF